MDSLVWKNNTPEKTVALLVSINKELPQSIKQNYALTPRVPYCGWQNKETSAILNHMYVAELRVDATGAEVDWKNKEMGAIFNHIQ